MNGLNYKNERKSKKSKINKYSTQHSKKIECFIISISNVYV